MHGMIFGELKKLVDTKLGGDSWNQLLADAGLGSRIYMPVGEYPDQEMVALVEAVSRKTALDARAVLEMFGEFIAPDLITLYRHLVKPEWRTLELLENTEATIHRVVRRRNPGARPPELKTARNGNEVLITYASARRMCGVAIGIVRGVAAYYREVVEIEELNCMSLGASACRILVRR